MSRSSWVWLDVRAQLQSDLHTGSGTGAAGVDAVLLRDRLGRPLVHRTHWKGLLRDAAMRQGARGLAEELFGRRGSGTQQVILTSLRCKRSDSRAWVSTARRSFDNRSPQDDTLRVIEYVPAGTTLQGTVAVPAGKDEQFREFLYRCERLGHGRNRGDGQVQWTVAHAAEPSLKIPDRQHQSRCLRLLLKAEEALTLPRTGHPGNLVCTEVFVRGSALHGALVNHQMRRSGPSPIWDAVSVGDAIPLPEEWSGQQLKKGLESLEALPIPLCLRFHKAPGAGLFPPWWADGEEEAQPLDCLRDGPTDGALKRPGSDEFLARLCPGAWTRYRPLVYVHLRNAQGAGPGGAALLFATEEIAEDTYFVADLHFLTDEAANDFVKTWPGGGWLTIGRGGAPMSLRKAVWVRLDDEKPDDANAQPVGAESPGFRLTLKSDLLLRDDWLNPLPSLDRTSLAAACGGSSDQVDFESAQASDVLHGFNSESGLPRAPVIVVRRGSSFKITGTGAGLLRSKLLAQAPLGDSTRFGLGRFRLDPEDDAPGTLLAARPSAPGGEKDEAEDVLRQAFELAEKVKGGPSRSQWFAFRWAVHNAATKEEVETLLRDLGRARGGRAWNEVAAVLREIRQYLPQNSEEKPARAAEFVDALVRCVFPRAGR